MDLVLKQISCLSKPIFALVNRFADWADENVFAVRFALLSLPVKAPALFPDSSVAGFFNRIKAFPVGIRAGNSPAVSPRLLLALL